MYLDKKENLNKENYKENLNKENLNKENENINSLAIIRADRMSRVKIALCDLVKYANLSFVDDARILEPAFADNILTSVMKKPLKVGCDAAAIVPLAEDAATAIGRIRKIHPPAHVVIVGTRHDIFYDLINDIDILPEIVLKIEQENLDE